MSDPRTPRQIVVRLPGPASEGDPFGLRWTEPGVTSPGEVLVRATCIEVRKNGSAVAELDGVQQVVPAARWSMPGELQQAQRRAVLNAVEQIATDGGPGVQLVARSIAAIITGQNVVDRLQDVLAAATRAGANDTERALALTAIGLAWVAAESE